MYTFLSRSPFLGGIGFTFILAAFGILLAGLPGFQYIGALATSILLAILFRQLFGYPTALASGLQFSTKKLLRVAIILFGLKLNIDVVLNEGLGLLAKGAGTIIVAITLTMILSRWFKANTMISMLLAVGTGVCGAAAIAAVSPILKSKEEDTALSVGIIALVGTIFGIAYTIIGPLLPLSAEQYGIWSGLSLHEIAHVALAAEPAGEDALAMALLAKLGRVLLLIPLSFILVFWMRRKRHDETEAQVNFPWFLIGFIVMSLVGTYLLGDVIPTSEAFLTGVSHVTTFLLAMAMSGLGLNVSLASIKSKAMRPLAAMLITSVVLSFMAYFVL
ncbi:MULTISPECIES: YeiH family protein [Pontibacillus]|uniref:Sulfate exporter family transporter n=1 Tax=Pontibacillus chungwhensis TaxID=265426 RepID=A0ABY8UX27_9BACI|nr:MULTISPECIES: putative sulfate exporter family transporter [Pontibacillus]MCD5323967.1 putative sulfate exporter family transporter [Pontibacillus sp. HN14]WIF97968.1 putative sulfate exporter family transporter [Pontibacillus chungwhensis]